MNIWNQIVNAVYLNEWSIVETAVSVFPTTDLDDANNMAETLGNIIAGRLHIESPNCIYETVSWILRQPYINREKFAEWVAMDALKNNNKLHNRVFMQVAPYCRVHHLREIEQHLAICDTQRTQSKQVGTAVPWQCCIQ